MKRLVKIIAIFSIIALIGFSIVDCNGNIFSTRLTGTYSADNSFISEITFNRDGTCYVVYLFGLKIECNYKVKENSVVITMKDGASLVFEINDNILTYMDNIVGGPWTKK